MTTEYVNNKYLRLFLISVLFMFIFQLEARLISYVYLFHEGLLLIQAMLLGGGLLLLAKPLLNTNHATRISEYVPLCIPAALLIQLAVFFLFNNFILDALALGLLFGLIFYEIVTCITLKSNHFYAIELLGSFVGVVLYVISVLFFLEEPLLVVAIAASVLYGFAYAPPRRWRIGTTLSLVAIGAFGGYMLLSNSLPTLLSCSQSNNAFYYKSACLDDSSGIEPVESFTHLKGRSDVYIRPTAYGVPFLEVKNNGYRVSAAHSEADRGEEWFDLLEHRIPALAYPDNAHILSIGAGAGSYVQALQSYTVNPTITAVEIDGTVSDMYEANAYEDFLPPLSEYTIVYDEGRKYVTRSDTSYDVITIAIEGINSIFPKYVDERTGLLYTREAFETYIEKLNEGGYLVLEQYYPVQEGGEGMAVKFLNTLHDASGDSIEAFGRNLFMYSWAFHPGEGAQRYIAAVYKPNGFTEDDIETITGWIDRFETFYDNPHRITNLHSPVPGGTQFDTYFDETKRSAVENTYNIVQTTDERPFRHLVTALPFPQFIYVPYILYAAAVIFLLAVLNSKRHLARYSLLSASAFIGILTFGLQYLLFYKTAAFIHFNLIFFSVFLLIPLLFGALGGYVSLLLKTKQYIGFMTLFALGAVLLASIDIFEASTLTTITLISFLFFVSGFLLPRVLEKAATYEMKTHVYAVNLCAGGVATVIMVTVHALFGWTFVFAVLSVLLLLSLLYLLKV